jgi:hypothetical protein
MAADLAPLLGSDRRRPNLLFRYELLAIGQGLALFPSVHFLMLRSQLHPLYQSRRGCSLA